MPANQKERRRKKGLPISTYQTFAYYPYDQHHLFLKQRRGLLTLERKQASEPNMESPQKPPQAHTLLFPLPVQGHITPMLQFAKRLVSRGLKGTLVTTLHLSKSIRIDPSAATSSSIDIETISDCQGGDSQPQGKSSKAHQMSGSRTLAELIRELDRLAQPVVAVVYDGFMPWALDMAKQCKKLGVAFFTQTCAVNNIYYHVQRGLLELPLSGGSVEVPGLPPLEPSEMPSFLYKLGSYPASYDMVIKQFSNVGDADLVLFNTIYELEKEVLTHKFALACCCHSFCKNYSFESTHHIIRWI